VCRGFEKDRKTKANQALRHSERFVQNTKKNKSLAKDFVAAISKAAEAPAVARGGFGRGGFGFG